jgi:serine/threonine-protein kinase RsbT
MPLDTIDQDKLCEGLVSGIGYYLTDIRRRAECLADIRRFFSEAKNDSAAAFDAPVVVKIKNEADIVLARNAARKVAARMGFIHTDQVRIATAVSELARNIVSYAQRGRITISSSQNGRTGLTIEARDNGPGISNLQEILAGSYRSKTGMGLGIIGCKRLMDVFLVETSPETGTQVTMVRYK